MGRFADWILGPAIETPEQRSTAYPLTDPSSNALVPPARPTLSGRTVLAGEALGLSAVYRAVSILTTSAKQISLRAYRDDARIDTPTLLKNPTYGLPLSTFIEQTVSSLAVSGNAFWKVEHSGDRNVVTNVSVLDPWSVQQRTDKYGNFIGWWIGADKYGPDDVAHLALLRVPGQWRGLGPIQASQSELAGAIDTRDYASDFFNSGGVPTGLLSTDQNINDALATQYNRAWNEYNSAKDGVAVLGNGFKYQSTFLAPKDAQWLEARSFDTTAIARLFGIPAQMMLAAVDGSSMTYTNLESEYIQFVRFSLMQYLKEIESALSLLLPGKQEVRFTIEALLRADTATRYTAHATALSAGFMTIQEVRDIENLGPAPAELKKKAATPPPAPVAAPVPADPAQGGSNV